MGGFIRVLALIGVLTVMFSGCGTVGSDDVLEVESSQVTSDAQTVQTEASTETLPSETTSPEPPAGPSLLSFLRTAMKPVGSTMYIWGGGWNEEDTGAGIEAVTLGISPNWAAFAAQQDGSYNYKNHRYQIHDGLDCSGYVGWTVYNTLETQDGQEGYVGKAAQMAQSFSQLGFGEYIPAKDMEHWQPGDIMSMKGHVWISLGMCQDGSVLLVHASPPGVILCGTQLSDGSDSQAVQLAEKIMKEHYPDWYSRYPKCSRSISYLTDSSAMRWSREVLSDEEGLAEMNAEEAIQLILAAD